MKEEKVNKEQEDAVATEGLKVKTNLKAGTGAPQEDPIIVGGG